MKLFSLAAVLVASVANLALVMPAQAAVITPGQYADTDAPAAQFGILGNPSNSASTLQFVVAASELTGMTTGAVISSIGFRFAGAPYLEPVGQASYSRYDIQIGQAASTAASPSAAFASNLGSDTVLARSGALTIPAGSFADLPGDGPNPFYDLAFTMPYTYAGGDLAVTIRFVPLTGNPAIAVDAFAPTSTFNTVFAFGSATAASGTVGQANAPVTRFTFATAAVPEPATWAMLIVGFGMVGVTVRRSSTRRAATV